MRPIGLDGPATAMGECLSDVWRRANRGLAGWPIVYLVPDLLIGKYCTYLYVGDDMDDMIYCGGA